MTAMVEDFRQLYNHVRPHETLAGSRPIEAYLADPDTQPSDDLTATVQTRQTARIP
jgi:hypothetical protein